MRILNRGPHGVVSPADAIRTAATSECYLETIYNIVRHSLKILKSKRDMKKRNESKTLRVVRWIARISSGFAAALILLIFIGEGLTEGFEPLLHMSVRETLMMVVFVALWLGLLLGWKWELYGGLLTGCGVVAFYLVDYLFTGTFPRVPFVLIFASPSLLFLYCGFQARKKPGAKST